MKKIATIIIAVLVLGSLCAELVITVPFEQDIIGQSYTEVGEYDYESDWIELANTGTENQDYTIHWSPNDAPAGWSMSVCNDLGICYMPNYPGPITINAGTSLVFHIGLIVTSTGGFAFDITIGAGDLEEPEVLSFTFNTADNTSAGIDSVNPLTMVSQNYPNPFNPTTSINYSLPADTNGSMTIFNMKGEVVRSYNNLSGNNKITWNGDDVSGATVSSGIYFYRLNGGTKTVTKKMILMK